MLPSYPQSIPYAPRGKTFRLLWNPRPKFIVERNSFPEMTITRINEHSILIERAEDEPFRCTPEEAADLMAGLASIGIAYDRRIVT